MTRDQIQFGDQKQILQNEGPFIGIGSEKSINTSQHVEGYKLQYIRISFSDTIFTEVFKVKTEKNTCLRFSA